MSARIFENHVTAEFNKAVPVSQPTQPVESIGPVTLLVHNQGLGNVVVQAKKRSDDSLLLTDKDTAQVAEDTLYDGTGAQLVFTGNSLNVVPIVPGSVVIVDAGAVAPNLIDKNSDGRLFTVDVDDEFAGTIDYFTGALELTYPAGKAPGTGATAITADYTSQDSVLVAGGRKNFAIANVLQEDAVVPAVAADIQDGSFVKIDGIATWI